MNQTNPFSRSNEPCIPRETASAFKCRLFFCPKRKSYCCCSSCEQRDGCVGRCKNTPQKCGYSSSRITAAEVVCPFFSWTSYRNVNERKRITCEGILPGTNDITCFDTDGEKTKHMLTFCCSDYISCAKAKELMRQYEQDGRQLREKNRQC